ncbi:hypothetical protein KM043_005584 [Ampulex compressa]|nr:hypothetical protein KM043_005584 [Ampulex compressa]
MPSPLIGYIGGTYAPWAEIAVPSIGSEPSERSRKGRRLKGNGTLSAVSHWESSDGEPEDRGRDHGEQDRHIVVTTMVQRSSEPATHTGYGRVCSWGRGLSPT